jgi:hemolysin III
MSAGSKRKQSIEEERANSLSHGLALLAAIVGAPILVIKAAGSEDGNILFSTIIFSLTLIFLYTASTFYHRIPQGKWKNRLQKMDHVAIFLLIAGTYTPFAIGVLRDNWGWILFGVVWLFAIVGIILELNGLLLNRKISNTLYLAMGWAIVPFVKPLLSQLSTEGLLLLALGGLFYTGGIVFYIKGQKQYYHFIWHLFVIAGSTSHYFAILLYA